MTDTIHNPYWEEVSRFPKSDITWKFDHRWAPEWMNPDWRDPRYPAAVKNEQVQHRDDLCVRYAWSIPDPVSLAFVSRHLGPNAIEIGAGSGYYSYCLAQLGTHVICYDVAPPQRATHNHFHSPRKAHRGELTNQTRPAWREIYHGNHNKAARFDYPLFLCWPPYASDMAAKALRAYQGSKLVYIGEHEGGCTADDSFFEILGKHWELVDTHRPIQWAYINDVIEVYLRKEMHP